MTLLDRLPYVLVMIFSACVCIYMAARAFQSRRKVARAVPFTVMAISCSLWMILVTLDTLITNLPVREMIWWLIPAAILTTLISLFFFALEFSLRFKRVPKAISLPIIIAAAVIVILAVTNPLHHQMWTVTTVNGFDVEVMGDLYGIQMAYIYLLTLGSLILLIRAFLLSSGVLRRQTVLLLVGLMFPIVVSTASDVFNWNPLPYIDEPALSIVFTVAFFGWATLQFNTFYLLPLASDLIIKNMQDGVLVTDVEGLIIFSNPEAQRIFEKKAEQVNGYAVASVLADWQPEAFQAWDEGKEEVQLIHGGEAPQSFRLMVSQLAGNSGESIGYLLTLYNNTEQKNYEKQLSEMAICDPLTGCYNRRYFYEMAHTYYNQTLRSAKPLSIMMLDLDHFKNVNDTYGHLKGDLVLQKVAAICKRLVRAQDIFSRYGGEEFILAMPETSLRDALIVAERLRRAIESLKNELEGIPITASIGVVETFGEDDLTLDLLLNCADEAMYCSKHDGRNRVTAWKKP